MLVWQSGGSHFFSRMITLAKKLARFSVPRLISFLLSEPYIQLDSCWFPLTCECLYAYLAMMVIVWFIGAATGYECLIASLSWQLAQHFLEPIHCF